jgi:hypothetical protein
MTKEEKIQSSRSNATLKNKIRRLLKSVYFQAVDDVVKLSDGEIGDLYLLVVSRKFKGMDMGEKNDLIWDILMQRLTPEEWGQISMTVARTPEERDPLENLR